MVACRYLLGLSEQETSSALGLPAGDGQVAAVARAGAVGGGAVSLEQRLSELAVEWPETPDVAARVRARLEAEPGARAPPAVRSAAPGHPARGPRARLGGVMAVPSARSTVLDWLGLGGVKIERVPETPTPAPTTPFDLGAPVPLARTWSSPSELGRPDAVYENGEIVTLLYRPETTVRRSSPAAPTRS